MASVYAIKTGNWSDPTVWNTGALPSAAEDVYANGFVVTIDGTFTVKSIRNHSDTGIANGGYFSPANGSVLTCTATLGVIGNLANFGCYHSTLGLNQSATLNATNISTLVNSPTNNIYGGYNQGPGNLTINGSVKGGDSTTMTSASISQHGFMCGIAGATPGTVTIYGNIYGGSPAAQYSPRIGLYNLVGHVDVIGNVYGVGTSAYSSADCTGLYSLYPGSRINIVGNVYAGASGSGVYVAGTGSVTNVTGNCFGGTQNFGFTAVSISSDSAATRLNVTGNTYGGTPTNVNQEGHGIVFSCAGQMTFTGTAYGGRGNSTQYNSCGIRLAGYAGNINITGNGYSGIQGSAIANLGPVGATINHTGTLDASQNPFPAFVSAPLTNNLVTGPFINNPINGSQAMGASGWKIKKAYRDTVYMAFYDDDVPNKVQYFFTQNALVGYPATTDVRDGTQYGPVNQYTGSCKVPLPANVLKGIPVGAAVGTLDVADAVWGALSSTDFAAGSMGERLKNASTVASTAAQLAAFGA